MSTTSEFSPIFPYKLKNLWISHVGFQKLFFFGGGGFFNNDYTFYIRNLFFNDERCPKFCKNQFFTNMFTFLIVIRQNFEYNLSILAYFRVKSQKSMDFAHTFSKN